MQRFCIVAVEDNQQRLAGRVEAGQCLQGDGVVAGRIARIHPHQTSIGPEDVRNDICLFVAAHRVGKIADQGADLRGVLCCMAVLRDITNESELDVLGERAGKGRRSESSRTKTANDGNKKTNGTAPDERLSAGFSTGKAMESVEGRSSMGMASITTMASHFRRRTYRAIRNNPPNAKSTALTTSNAGRPGTPRIHALPPYQLNISSE